MAARRGLWQLLGPHRVAVADLQVRKDAELQPPLMRFYYPCLAGNSSRDSKTLFASPSNRWLPSVGYAFGFISNGFKPSTMMRRAFVWVLACFAYVALWPVSAIPAFVSGNLLPEDEDNEKERLPVVVFSHGLWSCRTTYSALCCDLASYGYIVVALEHLDGSGNLACYIDNDGKKRWVDHKYSDKELTMVSLEDRSKQLKQRVKETSMVIDVLEALDRGSLDQSFNLVGGDIRLKVDSFRGRMDLSRIAIAGHSFGGATAIATGGSEKRAKCILGLDVWWEPLGMLDYDKLCGRTPVLLLNTEKFDWKALREARLVFLNARAEAKTEGQSLVTELATIKGTRHQNQSDFPLILPGICKKLGLSGELDAYLAKDINNRACLRFLQQHLRRPGMRFPVPVENVEADGEHLVYANI